MNALNNQLKILLAQPRFTQAIAAHARGNPEPNPVKRVHQAVGSIAPHLADLAAHHAAAKVAHDEAQKVPKASVSYRPGSVSRHCGNCSMYRDHLCSLVRGLIDPSATCSKWEAKKGASLQMHPSMLKHARQAPDGHHYVEHQPGKFARVIQGAPQQAPGGNMKEIEFIRHGSTDLNSEDTSVDVIRGHKDVPLNADGKKEAARTGEELRKRGNIPDAIVSSDLCRAKLTAQIISEKTDIPVSWVTEHFRPWDAGQLTGQPSKQAVPIMADYAANHPDEPLPGGESFHTFLGRFFIGLDAALHHPHHQGKDLAVIAHHRNERALHAWAAKGYPTDGSIDHKVFSQKGEHPGASQKIQIPLDRLRLVAQRYQNAAMAEPPAQRQVSDDQPGQE